MRYNFTLINPPSYTKYVAIGLQSMCWLLTMVNCFMPSIYHQQQLVTMPDTKVIYPSVIPDVLAFFDKFSALNIRLLSADIYPQELMIKGLSFESHLFLNFLKNIKQFANIKSDELLDWHRKKNGAWYFSLRMFFK
ncbi:MAG: hypothetical protein EBY16_08835 [Gammaproteobacteria bacterium]|nr:hypothetical protein [Gammaproteobacteria bacterium]